jgi:NADH-ubiquinone oxidoreductase chain 2
MLILTSTSHLLPTLAALSLATGALGAYNQTRLRKLIAYSSIAHMGGIILTVIILNSLTVAYLTIYVILSLSIITLLIKLNLNTTSQCAQLNNPLYVLTSINLLSLGGLPPLLGFVPK